MLLVILFTVKIIARIKSFDKKKFNLKLVFFIEN